MSPLFGLGLSALSSGFQLFKGAKQEKEAQTAIDAFEFKDLNNVYDGIGVSTMGSDLIREEAQRTTAGAVEAARSGGIQGVLSALPKIQSVNNQISQEAALDLDQQQQQLDYARAQDQARIRAMEEERQANELAGLGQKLATGQQNFFSGLNNLANTAMSASYLGSLNDPTPKQKKIKVQNFGLVDTMPKMAMPNVLSSMPVSLYNSYLSTSLL